MYISCLAQYGPNACSKLLLDHDVRKPSLTPITLMTSPLSENCRFLNSSVQHTRMHHTNCAANHYAIPLRLTSALSTVAPCSGRYENVWERPLAAVWVELTIREVVFAVRGGEWQCLPSRLCVDGDGCGRGAHRRGAAAPRPHHYHQHHFCSQWRNEACHCSSTSKLHRVRTGDPVAGT